MKHSPNQYKTLFSVASIHRYHTGAGPIEFTGKTTMLCVDDAEEIEVDVQRTLTRFFYCTTGGAVFICEPRQIEPTKARAYIVGMNDKAVELLKERFHKLRDPSQ